MHPTRKCLDLRSQAEGPAHLAQRHVEAAAVSGEVELGEDEGVRVARIDRLTDRRIRVVRNRHLQCGRGSQYEPGRRRD
jgi:hypothetical protein